MRSALIAVAIVLTLPAFPATAASAPTAATAATSVDADTRAAFDRARAWIEAGREAEADSLLAELQPLVEARYGAHSLTTADMLDLRAEAISLGGNGQQAQAQAWCERAVAIREADPAASVVSRALSLHRLALVQDNEGRFALADSTVAAGLAVLKAARLEATPTAAWLLATKAKLAGDLNDFQRAESALAQAQSIVETQAEPPVNLRRRLLEVQAAVLRHQGRLVDAIARRREAIALLESAYGPTHPSVARALASLANEMKDSGRLREAEAQIQRALDIYAHLKWTDTGDVASALNALTMVHMGLGDYAAAKDDGARALDLTRRQFGADHPNTVAVLNNLGILAYQTGDWETARTYFEQVLAADEKQFGPQHLYVAGDLTNLAAIVYYAGDVSESARLFDRAISTATVAGGPDHPAVGLAVANQAEVLAALGRVEEARAGFARGIPLVEAGVGAESPDVASLRDSYGVLLARLGDLKGARTQLSRALAIRETALGGRHADTALSRRNLANLMVREGRQAEAVTVLEGACRDLEAALGAHDPRLADGLADLAAARWRLGRVDGVAEPALRAESIGREHLRLVARGLPERQALAYAAARPAGLDLAVTAALSSGGAAVTRSAWDAAIGSRGLVLDEMIARRAAGWLSADTTATRLGRRLATARGRYANLSVRGAGELEPAVWVQEVDTARREKEQAERELARRSAAFRRVDRTTAVTLRDLSGALVDSTALVVFQRYRQGGDELRYAAFVLRAAGAAPVLVPLGRASALDSLVGAWRATIEAGAVPPGPLAQAAEEACRDAGTRLRQAAWDPLRARLRDVRRVFLVADGALHLVNFAALPSAADRYLIEDGPVFHLLNTERDLLPVPASISGRGLLALGGPDFERGDRDPTGQRAASVFRGTAAGCADFAGMRFGPLPGSIREVGAVADHWRRLRGAVAAEVATGAAATEAYFKRMAPGRRVLHLATHGFFLGDGCALAADGARNTAGAIVASSPAPILEGFENPLLLNGLALAAANRRASAAAGADDGVLTAEEIAALDLDGVQWAVLSGCDTGRGAVAAGEVLLGLRRAFQLAGVRTVISSLWPVRDDDAQLWMTSFYAAALERGLATRDAVRQADLAVLRARRADGSSGHPLAWGAFVASGDWR